MLESYWFTYFDFNTMHLLHKHFIDCAEVDFFIYSVAEVPSQYSIFIKRNYHL